jgi:Rhs element Vgr protein
MASSPITEQTDLISLSVKSGGSAIKDTYQVLSVYIENNLHEIPYCILELADGSAAKGGFPISDGDTFVPGAEIEVLAGYENSNQSIFKGIVIEHSLAITDNKGPVLRVLCKDKSVKMTVGRKNACFHQTTDSDLMTTLISNNGLSAEVSSTDMTLEEVIQYYSTDWDFMIARAEVNGLVVFAKDGKVFVKKPEAATEAVLTLTYGYDIFGFEGAINAEHQYKSVQASAWDPENQTVSIRNAAPKNTAIGNLSTQKLAEVIGLDQYSLQTSASLESGSLTNWAKAQASKSEYAKAKGHIKFQGSAKAEPGKLIELKGLGKRFNGNAFISGVVHDISEGNWITTARIGLSPEWYTARKRTEAPSASGLLPGIQGLQIGKVQQINEDPDSGLRVLVALPLIQNGENKVWARLATFYASDGAGAFFYPEVEDEVIVGFLNEDPRSPVILGSVYSKGRSAPESPDEKNTIKAFVSREKMKITFDEEKKEITITTPANNQLIMSDDENSITIADQNQNSIKMSANGIAINSASTVSINAAEGIDIEAGTSINMKASGGSISMDAMNISTTATTQLSASGGATVSISGGAEMTLTAAMIMIN